MKVIVNTTETVYTKSTLIKPKHPLWFIKNQGDALLVINGAHVIYRNDGFGVDVSKLISVILKIYAENPNEKNIDIVNDTQFSVDFMQSNPGEKTEFVLIETSFIIER